MFYTTPRFTKSVLDQTAAGLQQVECSLEEARLIYLGNERFYPLRAADGSRTWYAFGGVRQELKAEIEARTAAIRQLGYSCDVYQFTWPVNDGDPIWTIKLLSLESVLPGASPEPTMKEE